MAVARNLRVVSSTALTAETKLLELELPDGEVMNFVGGQYIIVNSGIVLPNGKVAKRAFSILSSDAKQHRFSIAVRRIGSGPGSNYMHDLQPGAEVPFSGPWGQYLPDDARPRTSTFVFATDTGITAALGLLQSVRFKPQLPHTRVVWFVESENYFLPASFVRDLIPSECGSFEIESAPAIGDGARVDLARSLVRKIIADVLPESAFLSGDGSVLVPMREDLLGAGMQQGTIRMETFFNHVIRKSPA